MTCWETFSPGIHVDVAWHASLTKTLSKTKNTQMVVASPSGTMHPRTQKNCLGMAQWTWQRAQGVAFLPPNSQYPNLIKNSSDFLKQVRSTMDGTWLWPIQAWTQDFWGCPVVSNTIVLSGDPLSSAGCKVEPPWIGSSKSYRCSIGLGSGQVETFSALSCSLSCPNSFWVWQGTAIRECSCHKGVYLFCKRCLAGWYMSSGLHMTACVIHVTRPIGVHLAISSQLWGTLILLQARDINIKWCCKKANQPHHL